MFDDEGIYGHEYWLYGEGTPKRAEYFMGKSKI
jgi:hypothetical protein